MTAGTATAVLEVRGLTVDYLVGGRPVSAVRDVTFSVMRGEGFGLLGESGAGKTTVALACMASLPRNAVVTQGEVLFCGKNILAFDRQHLSEFWGREVAIVPQDPHAALNPSLPVGDQIADVLIGRIVRSRREARERTLSLLETVCLREPERVMRSFPHELSGGMKQRVCIARALAVEPQLLLLDEPTTALDVTTQSSILDTVNEARRRLGVALLYITHDIRIVARLCKHVGIMAGGQLVERGPSREVLVRPVAAFSRSLVQSVKEIAVPRSAAPSRTDRGAVPLLEVAGLVKQFGHGRSLLRCWSGGTSFTAVDGVDIRIAAGETHAVVGESGSGKTTLARCIMGAMAPDAGEVRLSGEIVAARARKRNRVAKEQLGIVFQNPDASLNPRHSVRRIVERSVLSRRQLSSSDIDRRVRDLLSAVQLDASFASRFPRELSGGQKQRVAIARAFANEPTLVILDEATSSLDMTVQVAILQLLSRLQRERGTAYLFISHDIHVVRHIADTVTVMQSGQVCETGAVSKVLSRPQHPYTQSLIEAARVGQSESGDLLVNDASAPITSTKIKKGVSR